MTAQSKAASKEEVDSAPAVAATSAEAETETGSALKLVKVLYPTDQFVIEGIPVITALGTKVSAADAKTIQDQASANGVRVIVEDAN